MRKKKKKKKKKKPRFCLPFLHAIANPKKISNESVNPTFSRRRRKGILNFIIFSKSTQSVLLKSQPRKIQFLRTFGVGPFFFFFGSNQRERYFSMEHGRWKVARRSLHQLPQPPPETFDDDNPQPPKINWSP